MYIVIMTKQVCTKVREFINRKTTKTYIIEKKYWRWKKTPFVHR